MSDNFELVCIDPNSDEIVARVDLVPAKSWSENYGHKLRLANEVTFPAGCVLEMRYYTQ